MNLEGKQGLRRVHTFRGETLIWRSGKAFYLWYGFDLGQGVRVEGKVLS